MHSLPWITIFKNSWGDLPMIFIRDFVTRENHWQITPLVTKISLFTVIHALFFMYHIRQTSCIVCQSLCEVNLYRPTSFIYWHTSCRLTHLIRFYMYTWTVCYRSGLFSVWTSIAFNRADVLSIPTRIFYRGVPGFATDCPCGVWCRGLTTCPPVCWSTFWKSSLK